MVVRRVPGVYPLKQGVLLWCKPHTSVDRLLHGAPQSERHLLIRREVFHRWEHRSVPVRFCFLLFFFFKMVNHDSGKNINAFSISIPRGMFFSVDLVEHLFGLEGYFQIFKSFYSEGEIHRLWNNVAQNCFQELILPLPGSVNHPVNIPLWECVRHMMFTQ